MQTDIATIKHIIELALGHSIVLPNHARLIDFTPESIDELALLKEYLQKPNLITKELKADLVATHLAMFPLKTTDNIPPKNWDDYLSKLESALAEVKYKAAHNYALEQIMPTHAQLQQWQQECIKLTEDWYGVGKGNLSCFYNYFIAMSQAAGITYFKYLEIKKFISEDGYLSAIDKDQRRQYFLHHEQFKKDYLEQGGYQAQGVSIIDATNLSNILYYKDARLYIYHTYIKHLVVAELNLEDYAQLPYKKRVTIWHLLQKYFPAHTPEDQNSIFYKFVAYVNARPGEYFNYFAENLPEAADVSQETLHDIIKVVGLQTRHLYLLPREIVENWIPKRYFTLQWQREFPLTLVDDHGKLRTLRAKHSIEYARIMPNELPYAPGHGLSLCGNGLVDMLHAKDYTTKQWNNPLDLTCNVDNWPRDVEKLFKEFKFFYPRTDLKHALPGETACNMFHNSMAYSTIHTTQHTHIATETIDDYGVYILPEYIKFTFKAIEATIQLVQVGDQEDAIYMRCVFDSIENTKLLQFLIDFNDSLFRHFGGCKKFDVHLHLFVNKAGKLVFIYEPHVLLIQLDHDTFKNPINGIISKRKPQFLKPQGEHIESFTDARSNGLNYIRNFFDATACPGVKKAITQYLDRSLQAQP